MPKLQNLNDADFLASVQLSLNKVHNKALQNRRAFEEQSKPDYWKEQNRRKNNPKVKSYDSLTDYILI